MENLSKSFYLGSIAGAGILGTILIGAEVPFGAILVLYAAVVSLVMWYKAWKAIQDGHARTTPGKAVGFLFIPFYNLYWIFQAIWGFAKDYNSYITRHEISTPKLTEGLFLTYCILTLVTGVLSRVAVAGLVFSIINLVILIIIVIKVCDAVNSLPQPTET